MNNITRTGFLLGALAVTFCCAVYASPPLPQNPGLTDAMRPAVMPTLEDLRLSSLEDRLLETDALSASQKLALMSAIEKLQERFRAAHAGNRSVASLRPPYDRLIAKMKASLKNDPVLARDLEGSKETLWASLADPAQFAGLSIEN